MGKCFSGVNRGQRKKSDFYQTPIGLTKQLIEHEYFNKNKVVLNPACGDFMIGRALRESGFKHIHESDIRMGADFLKLSNNYKYDYLIENPPFSLAFEFIQKAKEIIKYKFAYLLPLSYLHGQKRYESKIFTDKNYPLSKIYVFTRYPLLTDKIRNDGKYETGMIAYIWAIWDKFHKGPATINWINNQEYILKKEDK